MPIMKLWTRVGDSDGYTGHDGLEEVAAYLAEMGATGPLEWANDLGVSSPEFRGNNYISLFWGDGNAQPIRSLTPDEFNVISDNYISRLTTIRFPVATTIIYASVN